MPANLPSSFASAAAGQNANRDSRARGAAGGDWSRRDGRSANGTLTFRRSSMTPSGLPSPQLPSTENSGPNTSLDPASSHLPTDEPGPLRYTREGLLEMYPPRRAPDGPSRLFISGWDPGHSNGNARGWTKASDAPVPQEPRLCWEETGETTPLGLQDMSPEDKEIFSTEVNSPLKHPIQNKDGQAVNVNGRKTSLSQGVGNTYGVSSPSTARPGTRRRETTDSNPFSSAALASPSATNRFNRDDPSFWFPRKPSEVKEADGEGPDSERIAPEAPSRLPFGNMMRSNTAGSAGPTSPWASTGQTTPGAGTFGSFAMPSSSAVGDKRVGSISGGSRLAHLIPKEGPESSGAKHEASMSSTQQSWRSRPRTDTDPFGDDGLSGSAVLGGAQDTSSGPSQGSRAGTLGTPVKGAAADFGMAGLGLGGQGDDNGPLSPSETNPYRSPLAERRNRSGTDGRADDKSLGGGNQDQPSSYNPLSRELGGALFEGSDRSQTSSVGPKAYPQGTMSGWPASGGPAVGTPDRERANLSNAFGNSLFAPMPELQSPGLSGLNSLFGPASAAATNTGTIGRGSKLGSLFPPAMQAQMQGHEYDSNLNESSPDVRQSNPLGAIGRHAFQAPARESDSPLRSTRGVFEELFPSSDANRSVGMFGTPEPGQTPGAAAGGLQSFDPASGGMPFGTGQPANEPSSAQARQMVMPDRMRWVYLDPQGNVQGPFTGLEMNDWYKAHFFTPDLRVRKVEDNEFEPLGQLIRRIGNSREPFLVPQIGIAHGAASQTGPFQNTTNTGVVPPLSGVFPSFGRTLTAEEQNNLERRKQEEQFMMAQQREFLMRQQAMSKLQMPGQGLQHQLSAHSLQSQPSFGSMTSPATGPQQQQQQSMGAVGPLGGYFPAPAADAQSGQMDFFREDNVTQLTAHERQILVSLQDSMGDIGAGPLMELAAQTDLQTGLPGTEQLEEDSEGFRGRLQEFENLRAQHDAEQAKAQGKQGEFGYMDTSASSFRDTAPDYQGLPAPSGKSGMASKRGMTAEDISLSLTQQVQNTQASSYPTQPMPPPQPGMPMPFPPPSSTTPLPAPTAQRVRSNLPEQYSRDQTDSPDANASATVQTPALAPWAKDPGHESQRGPSLREIQEVEARKAAKAEEAAAVIRKAVMEQEAAILREKERAAAVIAAGLPASSNWAHGSPVSAASPWSKPTAVKMPAPGLTSAALSASKKTLADIQREEESRKQKARDTAILSGAPVGISKSYANLAGKPGNPLMPNAQTPATAAVGAGWATVGAGGKVKIPTGPAAQARSVSASIVKAAAAPAKPMAKPLASSSGRPDGSPAMDEFNKWVHRELSRGITGVNDIASFQATLDVLPPDTGIIADAVYANSTTMDGRHFAEEFIRRKKLAEKGVVERQPSVTDSQGTSASSGWNEVAKKGGAAQAREGSEPAMPAPGFKVVPSRKKGKK